MIKAVIFDCFGVLYVPVGEDFFRSHMPHYRQHRAELHELSRQADYGLISRKELVIAIAELGGLDPKNVRDNLVGNMVRNRKLLDYAEALRKTCKIGLLSNISSGTMDTFFTPKERRTLFDTAVISSEVGMIKPNPEIFSYTCRQLGVDESEAIMIDDSPPNCSGAIEAGLQAVVYSSTQQVVEDLRKRFKIYLT